MIRLTDSVPEIYGELLYRAVKNEARLSSRIYRPDVIYSMDQAGWPGDWEGRTILALAMHYRVQKRPPAYLKEMIEDVPNHLNARGYVGRILPEGIFDEQQFSGHNWFIRGLMEYYLITGEEHILGTVSRIVENLYLPAKGYYTGYPLDPTLRGGEGSYSGRTVGTGGAFILSSDIGCAFMCLDGLSQYYLLKKDSRVADLLYEMIAKFAEIDFVAANMQTHAALSAARGILRMYEATGDAALLEIAERIFGIYCREGMTENYANFNWFGRKDTWTEPCAITDSLILALMLFRSTGNENYPGLAHRIYYNAFCYAQRSNGGFGTDRNTGPYGRVLRPHGNGLSEAYWCCTMRGAEGIKAVAENLVASPDGKDIYLLFGGSYYYDNGHFTVSFKSNIPYGNGFEIVFKPSENYEGTIHIYNGSGFSAHRINAAAGIPILIRKEESTPALHEEKAFATEGKKYFAGDLLLGIANQRLKRALTYDIDGLQLSPLTDMIDVEPEELAGECRQIVF